MDVSVPSYKHDFQHTPLVGFGDEPKAREAIGVLVLGALFLAVAATVVLKALLHFLGGHIAMIVRTYLGFDLGGNDQSHGLAPFRLGQAVYIHAGMHAIYHFEGFLPVT